jgi:signal transduction histidine kinase
MRLFDDTPAGLAAGQAVASGRQAALGAPGWSSTLFNRLVFAAVVVGFLALAAVMAASAWTVRQNQEHSRWVDHTYEVERAISDFQLAGERAETARRGYLLKRDQRFYRAYRQAAADQPEALARAAGLTQDNPGQQRRITQLRVLMLSQLDLMEQSVGLARNRRPQEAMARFQAADGGEVMFRIRDLTARMIQVERALLQQRQVEQQRSGRALTLVLILAGVIVTLVAIGSIWTLRHYTRDLARSHDALRELNEGLEEAVRERTTDLTRANEEIQRFAYIVSHDLRSPLVNVMGFTSELEAAVAPLGRLIDRVDAELPALVDDAARTAAKQDLPEAIGFIRASTGKMDRLINAILRLSREGRRILSPEALSMGAILGGVADSLKHRATELGARIEVEGPLPDIVSDRIVIEQVFSNLVENAVKYLQPGRPGHVVIRGRRLPGRVVYEVQDNGRGVDPKDHERIFELFRRSGVQDQPGEGLGLAHVRALVYRLGGVISCESALDQGVTFRISLPAIYAPQGAVQ